MGEVKELRLKVMDLETQREVWNNQVANRRALFCHVTNDLPIVRLYFYHLLKIIEKQGL